MFDEILNPNNWKPFEVESQLKFLRENEKKSNKKKPNYWVNSPQIISPLALYKYLKARFGPPNGFITMFADNSSDNLIHWHYSLITHTAVIDIFGKNSGLEILVKTNESKVKFKPKDWQKLIENLQNNFKFMEKKWQIFSQILNIGHYLLIRLQE